MKFLTVKMIYPNRLSILVAITTIGVCYSLQWKKFQGKEFAFIEQRMNWIDAQAYCNSIGGRLAHVENSAENQFLRSIKIIGWLGGSDMTGSWKWQDPVETMTYKPFASGEPNRDANKNCLLMYTNGWHDNPCTTLYSFFCENKSVEEKSCSPAPSTKGKKCMTICL